MRIFNGRDYYDCGMSLGIDKTVTLVRSKDTLMPDDQIRLVSPSHGGIWLKAADSTSRFTYGHQEYLNGISIQMRVVVFCNKYYLGAEVNESQFNKPSKTSIVWSADKLQELLAKHGMAPVVGGTRMWSKTSATGIDDFFTPRVVDKDLMDCMIANRYSILVVNKTDSAHKKTVAVNPFCLKQMEFAKAIDPYTAFQELSMWVGGVLGGYSPEIVSIKDDKVLIENHGYDKYSFRSQERP